jgi:tetratricopeptide (TPR) repeat protein
MTKKRSHARPKPSRRADLAFKLGLTLLFLAALAVTFWPFSPEGRGTATPGDAGETATATIAAPTVPSAPAIPDEMAVPTAASELSERADALLVERLLESGQVPELTQFGTDLLARGDFTNAVRVFRRTVDLDPNSELNHFNLGLAHARLQQTNEAILQFREALEIYPDFAEAHNSLGLQLAALGDFAGARKHYETAVEVQPDFPVAMNNLGSIFARNRRFEEAAQWFAQAVEKDPGYVEARFNLANVELATGRTNEALGRLQDLVNEFPAYRPAQMVLNRLMSAEEGR